MRVGSREVGSQESDSDSENDFTHDSRLTTSDLQDAELTQLLNTYIVAPSANGFLLIHQQVCT